MIDEHYRDPVLASLYDLDSGWSVDRDFYLALAGSEPKRILDLGCGTGLLCNAYAARGHVVTGADPARAMLDIARRKPNGHKVDWVQASAETFQASDRFDLIVMTGNAFMTLVDDEAIAAGLATMRRHLAEGGTVAFECRNPRIDWRLVWDYDIALDLDGVVVHETRRYRRMEGPVLVFELRYAFPDRTIATTSRVRFSAHDEVERQLSAAGLNVHRLLGGWEGQAFDPAVSKDMIFVAGQA